MRIYICSLLLIFLCGCSTGSHQIESSFIDYNKTIDINQKQQMLLNLVRMKYRETPTFLTTSNLSVGFSNSADFGSSRDYLKRWGLSFGARTEERPTISYSPLVGEEFQNKLLKEFTFDQFSTLVRSGWKIKTLLCVMTEEGEKFEMDLLNYPELIKIIKGESGEIILEKDKESYSFNLRSLNDIMFAMAKNVFPPRNHKIYFKPGTSGINFKVHCGMSKNDYISVWYKKKRFYIADYDLQTKDIFALLMTLYNMKIVGTNSTSLPVLTINAN